MLGEEYITRDIRRKIFSEELSSLRDENYINEKEYGYMVRKYNGYYSRMEEVLFEEKIEKQNNSDNILEDMIIYEKTNNIREIKDAKNIKIKRERSFPVKKDIKAKKVITQEDIRERNLTILLLLGTIFIFIAGLIFATSTWDIIGDSFKTIILILMGTIFFGVSTLCEKVFKIDKTGFTFWLLGTLFLPLALLSIKILGLLGNYLSVNGEGTYLFNVISGIICMPIFYYSFKRYSKKVYLYISVIAVDFLIINLGLVVRVETLYALVLINVLNGILIYLNKIKGKFEEDITEKVILFNMIISFILILVNFSDTYVFFFNLLVIALLLLDLNYANRKIRAIYSIGATIFIALGVLGILVKFIEKYLIDEYVLAVPLIVFIIFYIIYIKFEKWISLKDRYIFNIAIGTGIFSILLMSFASPFYLEYRFMAIISLLINAGLLIYINSKEEFKIYNYILQGSFVVTIGSLIRLLDIETKLIDINLRRSVIVFLFFGIWIVLRKLKPFEKVYNSTLFTLYGYSILGCFGALVYGDIPNIFINTMFVSLISFYGYKQNIIKKVSIVATIITSYLTLLLSSFKVIDIYKEYNLIVHMIIVSTLIIGIIYILKFKFKIYKEKIKYLVIVNNLVGLVIIGLCKIFEVKKDIMSNLIFAEILIIINIGYFVCSYIIKNHLIYPSIIGINFGIAVSYIAHRNNFQYSYYIGIIAAVLVILSGYVYYREDDIKKNSIISNLYMFFALVIALGSVDSIVLNIISIGILICMFVIGYKENNRLLNIISLWGGIYLTDINIRNIFDSEISIFIIYVILIIAIRAIGLKIYKRIYTEGKFDSLAVLGILFVVRSFNYIYIATGYEDELTIFIIATIIATLIVVEVIRDKKNRGLITILSQAILSFGIYNLMIYLSVEEGILSKVVMTLIIGLYLTFKFLFKEIPNIIVDEKRNQSIDVSNSMDIVISIVITYLILKDIVIVDTVTNNIIMSSLVIIVMLIFMKKQERLLLKVAVLNLLIIVIYASRAFIINLLISMFDLAFNIPWWVYLLIIGSGFVGLAINLEKKRNKNNNQ